MRVSVRSPIWRRALRSAGLKMFHLAENNGDSCAMRNGEAWLLRQVIASGSVPTQPNPLVVFDIGANVGDYTRMVLREAQLANREIDVYTFEPSARNAAILQQAFVADSNVRVMCVAVADKQGQAILYSESSGSSQASLVKRRTPVTMMEEITVPMVRLDQYMASHNLCHLDLVKLDVEGAELAALRGLGEQLQPSRVELIQFEYGGTTLDAGNTLRDFYQLLCGRGYVIAKLLPHALELRSYQPWMEHYAYANYVALSPQLLQTVKG